ncbi:MAG: hypothetical protein KF869_02890 [Phycisphaeraceae bacterium]|nr:hypothetical protein [Phycisphaeraceae bacterium]
MHGSWEPLVPIDMHFRAIHLAHLKIGKFLYWADGSSASTQTALYDPGDPNQQPIYHTGQNLNLHCCGHSSLADGRLFTAGGEFNAGIAPKFAAIFNPTSVPPAWTRKADMHQRRWYPTCTTLPDGKVAVFAGWTANNVSPPPNADIPEIYDPATDTWEQKPSATRVQEIYPFMFVMPDGRLFDAGPNRYTHFLDPATWTWGAAIDSILPTCADSSAVMFDAVKGKILKAGGAPVSGTGAATDTTVVFGGLDDPTWSAVGTLKLARRDHNMVVLPDGKVVAIGGTQGPTPKDPVMRAEVFDPGTGDWTVDPVSETMAIPRWYHSTASLMRDGRVIAAGGQNDGVNCQNCQYYRPPICTAILSGPCLQRMCRRKWSTRRSTRSASCTRSAARSRAPRSRASRPSRTASTRTSASCRSR